MKLRRYVLVFGILLFSILLTACSSSEETNQPKSNSNATGSASDTTTGSSSKGAEKPAEQEPVYGGDLIIGSIGAPTTFNALYASDTASGDIIAAMFNSLTSVNEKLEPMGDLAESWEITDDGLTWTFKLKQGVKWHDGEELTADDVVFTYTLPLSDDFVSVRKSDFENVESIVALDKYTVQIKIKEVDADFVQRVPGYPILPKHILADVPVKELEKNEFNTKSPIGTGPFKFDKWVEGEYVKVVRFDDYFEGKPYLDSITWKIVPDQNALLAQLQSGEINVMSQLPASEFNTWNKMKEQGKIQVFSGLDLAYTYIGWNGANPLFADKKVRQALTYAFDREAIIDAVLNGQGEVAHTPESPLSWAYNPDVPKFKYDVEKAKQLLEEAGWKDTDGDGIREKDGKKFSFELMTNQGNKSREMIAQIAQQQLKEVGVEAKPRLMEWSAFINDYVMPKKFDAIILGWSLSTYPDPTDLWHSKEIEEGFNFVSFNRPDLDKLMEKNTKILDQAERKKVLGEIQAAISEEQPYTFLYYPIGNRAFPVGFKGYTFHPKSQIYQPHKWWIEK
ncbi:ABC transporter substrate-binding protein [Microaerobacter geothermalis]|uniref:peptide-binding protein n=1 Tax=Microaerobacter geothermalis TaxID=674972 RepID=UPI001F2DB308|nr:peptide-binding protein [Microaerobacter geothermalis]MCF6094132.1 ABC transporter substrate-binding protein [Microaerobacter geothermalis]